MNIIHIKDTNKKPLFHKRVNTSTMYCTYDFFESYNPEYISGGMNSYDFDLPTIKRDLLKSMLEEHDRTCSSSSCNRHEFLEEFIKVLEHYPEDKFLIYYSN